MADVRASRAFLISALLLRLGRCLKSLIMSMGKANSPTPPNITSNIQPKNDSIAMMYTANDAYSSIYLLLEAGKGTAMA